MGVLEVANSQVVRKELCFICRVIFCHFFIHSFTAVALLLLVTLAGNIRYTGIWLSSGNMDLFILYIKYHGCWLYGDAMRKGIHSHSIDMAFVGYSGLNTIRVNPWWRHQMETIPALLAVCEGNSPVSGEFPAQRLVTLSFDVLFDLRLNKLLSKQSRRWWFETLSHPLWRHCNG